MAGLELDPREVFEEFLSKMSDEQHREYRECLETASILKGHPIQKLERRVERFARVIAYGTGTGPCTLIREDGQVQIDVRAKPGTSFVPLWSSVEQAERACRFAFDSGDDVRVLRVQLDEFLSSAHDRGWSIGVEPTVGLGCEPKHPREILALVKKAKTEAAAEQEPPSDG